MEKLFKFVNEAAKRDFKALPVEAITQFGSDLNAVQQGEKPFDGEPLPIPTVLHTSRSSAPLGKC